MATALCGILGIGGLSLPGCAQDDTTDNLPPTSEPEGRAVAASFTLDIDPSDPALDRTTLEPKSEPAKVSGSSEDLGLRALVKRIPHRKGLLRVELYVENRRTIGLRDVSVTVKELSADRLYDLTADPFAEAMPGRSLLVARLAAEGIGSVVLGVPSDQPVHMQLELSGVTSRRTSTRSAPIQMAPDGKEVWVAWPDGDVVAVVDTASDRRLATVPVAGAPSSVALTGDGRLILVASATANTVTVIDRASRSIVQTLTEQDGIGREPRNLVVSPDGDTVLVSAFVGDTITALSRMGDRYQVAQTVTVGRRPVGMTVSPDGVLLVAHLSPRGKIVANQGWISVLSTQPLQLLREVPIFDPGNPERIKCLTDILKVDPLDMAAEFAPLVMSGIFLNPAGTQGWLPAARNAGSPIMEQGPKSIMLTPSLNARPGEIADPDVLLFDTRQAAATERLLAFTSTERPVNDQYVRCARIGVELEFLTRTLVPGKPTEQVERFSGFYAPSGALSETGIMRHVSFTRGGRRALLLSHMADEIIVADAITLHPTSQHYFKLSGANPLAMALTPDGSKGYVVYENSPFVSVLSLGAYAQSPLPGLSFVPYEYRMIPEIPGGNAAQPQFLVRHTENVPDRPDLRETTQVPLLDTDPLDPVLRRGKILFSSSNVDKYPHLTQSRLGSCAACHPSGGSDGSAWGTMEGERRTMSLRGGVAGRGWLHQSGTHKDASEFVQTIVKERLGGSLEPADVQALASYIARGIPKLQSPRVDANLAASGKTLFEKNCRGCHQGAQFTSGAPDDNNPWGGGRDTGPGLYDVGTATSSATVNFGPLALKFFPKVEADLMNALRGDRDLGPGDLPQMLLDFQPRPARKRGQFKAPSLVNVWDNSVFFHDGSIDKLDDAVHYMNQKLAAGLSPAEERAIVEYLKTL